MTNITPGEFTPPTAPLYDQTTSVTETDPVPSTSSSAGSASPKVDTAKREASHVADDAQDATKHVAGVAKEQAAGVASEAKDRARDLAGQATAELKEQAGVQQQKAAKGLQSISDELASMADTSDATGFATDLVRNLAGRAGSAASFLEGRDPGSLLHEVKAFAARKPGTFIALAAGTGVLAGRLAKALAADAKNSSPSTSGATPPTTTPETPVVSHEPPFRTEAAFADYSGGADGPTETSTMPASPSFDDVVGNLVRPGTLDEEQR
jgi:hypothetical protein